MIPAQQVVDLMKFELDSEGSDRYLFDTDFKPAINSAIKWLVFVFNRAFEGNKFSGENLRDLIKTRIWVANSFSRVQFDETAVGDELWSYLGVHPEPTVYPNDVAPPQPNAYTSTFIPSLSYISSDYSAKKLSVEKWNENKKNVFEAGNTIITTGDFKSYAYLTDVNYSSSNYLQDKEIEIRPSVGGQFVGITYLKVPTAIALITENIDPNARIIFGATSDETIKKDEIKITVVATGFDIEGSARTDFANFGKKEEDDESDDEFRKSEISSFIDEEEPSDLMNGFGSNDDFSNENFRSSPKRKSKDLDDDNESPLNDSDDDIEIPAFIRKKIGK